MDLERKIPCPVHQKNLRKIAVSGHVLDVQNSNFDLDPGSS